MEAFGRGGAGDAIAVERRQRAVRRPLLLDRGNRASAATSTDRWSTHLDRQLGVRCRSAPHSRDWPTVGWRRPTTSHPPISRSTGLDCRRSSSPRARATAPFRTRWRRCGSTSPTTAPKPTRSFANGWHRPSTDQKMCSGSDSPSGPHRVRRQAPRLSRRRRPAGAHLAGRRRGTPTRAVLRARRPARRRVGRGLTSSPSLPPPPPPPSPSLPPPQESASPPGRYDRESRMSTERPQREQRFERRMSDAEALMWNVEKDPWLNPSGGTLILLDRRAEPRPLPSATRGRGGRGAATARTRRARPRPAQPTDLATRSGVRPRLPHPVRRAAGAGDDAATARPGQRRSTRTPTTAPGRCGCSTSSKG